LIDELHTSQADGKKSTVSIPQSDKQDIVNIVSSFSKNHRTININNTLERKKTQTRFQSFTLGVLPAGR
jgi:hypothetical protein